MWPVPFFYLQKNLPVIYLLEAFFILTLYWFNKSCFALGLLPGVCLALVMD